MKILVTLILFVVLNAEVYAQLTEVNNQPIELGMVSWFRNYDEALDQANRQKKPLFILFQEVPGCATCQKYGNNVLSNPHRHWQNRPRIRLNLAINPPIMRAP